MLCLAAGVVLLVAAPFAWAALRPAPAGETLSDINAAAAQALAADPGSGSIAPTPDPTADADPSVAPDTTPDVAPDPAAGAAPVAESPAPTTTAAPPPAPSTQAPPAPGPPLRLQLPSLGIDSPVIGIGVTDTGELEIPEDVDDIGWYRYGPAPGEGAGSAVLTGHVDSASQGAGPFARLGELAEGDPVTVVDETGVARTFTVLSREEWAKSEVPLDRIFDRGGSPRLVLITCGGDFDRSSGHYEDNIAITAVPVGTGPA